MKKTLKIKLYYLISKFMPIMKKTVFFQSFGGQYNDNPKYISQKLHSLDPNLKIVWAISDRKSNKNDIPGYIKIIDIDNEKEYLKYATKCEVFVDNMNGIRGFTSKFKLTILPKLFKSKKQLNISTWHGVPLKKIGLDTKELENVKFLYTSADYISAGSNYSFNIFKRCFNPTTIKMNGSPRNDILINKKVNIEDIKKKLSLPLNKKILLFAPTFRKSIYESGIHQLEEIDVSKLLKILEKKMGGEWIFVFRVHHEVLREIQSNNMIDNKTIFSGNEFDDMAEYLYVSDCLITDYSGSMFDYMLTKKPCFLIALDKENYINDERGTYLSLDELPYSFSESAYELYNNIEKYNRNEAVLKIDKFLAKIKNNENGNSSYLIAKDIINYIYKKEL